MEVMEDVLTYQQEDNQMIIEGSIAPRAVSIALF